MKLALLLLILIVALLAAVIRLAPYDPAYWHIDPRTAPDPGQGGVLLLPPEAPHFDITPAELAVAVDSAALSLPRTRRIAGSPEDGRMTYLTRTLVWGFPDFMTIGVIPAGEGSTLEILSRSRFGKSDWGVNAGRVKEVLDRLAQAVGGA